MHVWHTFLTRAHIWQSSVFLKRAWGPGFQRKTVKGRSHVLHAPPAGSRVMRTYGLSPRHVSHRMGNSDCSHWALVGSALIRTPRSAMVVRRTQEQTKKEDNAGARAPCGRGRGGPPLLRGAPGAQRGASAQAAADRRC
jgi:hypothetical protein